MACGAHAAVNSMHLHALGSSWPCRICISQPSMLQARVLVMTLMSMPVSDPDFCRGQSPKKKKCAFIRLAMDCGHQTRHKQIRNPGGRLLVTWAS